MRSASLRGLETVLRSTAGPVGSYATRASSTTRSSTENENLAEGAVDEHPPIPGYELIELLARNGHYAALYKMQFRDGAT